MRDTLELTMEDGTRLAGWFFHATERAPTVILAHGFSALKECHLDRYGEVFAAAGINAVAYDHRGFGASEGRLRLEVDPEQQIRDMRDVITRVSALDGIDPTRIGLWGSSYAGGHVIVVAALDRRVRAVVSQAPLISGSRNARRLIRADLLAGLRQMFDADRVARIGGAEPAMIPVVSGDPMAPCVMPSADAHAWFTETAKCAPRWENQVTLRSVEMFLGYEPGIYIDQISPTPLMMIIAKEDHVTVADEALAAYERALEPKALRMVAGGHFDVYGAAFDQTSGAARDWFLAHL